MRKAAILLMVFGFVQIVISARGRRTLPLFPGAPPMENDDLQNFSPENEEEPITLPLFPGASVNNGGQEYIVPKIEQDHIIDVNINYPSPTQISEWRRHTILTQLMTKWYDCQQYLRVVNVHNERDFNLITAAAVERQFPGIIQYAPVKAAAWQSMLGTYVTTGQDPYASQTDSRVTNGFNSRLTNAFP